MNPMRKKTRIPNANIKSTAPQWEETRTAFCRWKRRTTPRYKKAFNRVASKLNTLLETLHATPHQLPDTEKFSITIESTSVHPCKDPRQHSKIDTYLVMLMPGAKNVLKNRDALFWIDPFVWPRKHTYRKNNVSEISDTREKMTTITTTTYSEKQLAELHTTRFLCTFLPSMCRTRNYRNTNGTETSEKPVENTNQIAITEANNKTSPQHHLQLTFTLHNTDALNKLIRFVVSFGDHVHRQK